MQQRLQHQHRERKWLMQQLVAQRQAARDAWVPAAEPCSTAL